MKPTTLITVHLDFGRDVTYDVGRIVLERARAMFEYNNNFAESGLTINPLMEQTGTVVAPTTTFDGLHGVFADSLPDAWGQTLVRRRLRAEGVSYDSLTVLDRLSIVGHGGMGALIYDPQIFASVPRLAHLDLDAIAAETLKILRGEQDGDVVELERLGGSSGGARPKITAFMDESGKRISSRHEAGLDPWMIKFRITNDFDDIGPLEAAYADMARAAGLEMAPTRLLQSSSGPGFFATKRFDREEEGAVRAHMASAAGLGDIAWTEAGTVDYDTLMKIVGVVTRQHPDIEQMFRRMAFNVVATNRDDHPKQHAFLMDTSGKWRLAPAFDLTYSPGPNGQHNLDINGKGNQVTAADLEVVGTAHGIKNIDVVIDEVSRAVRQFQTFAERYGVGEQTYDRVANEIALRFKELDAAPGKKPAQRRARARRAR